MPRRNLPRRFDPRFGVSQITVNEEAKYLAREVDDWEVVSNSKLDSTRSERHVKCRQAWEHFTQLLPSLPERRQRVLHSLLFRDLYLVLELYLAYIATEHPDALASHVPPVIQRASTDSEQFQEFLFNV